MKPGIHPEYMECTVRCSCGNTFVTRATVPEIRVELCNECHPFYTGQQKFVDTGGRVQRFADKFARPRPPRRQSVLPSTPPRPPRRLRRRPLRLPPRPRPPLLRLRPRLLPSSTCCTHRGKSDPHRNPVRVVFLYMPRHVSVVACLARAARLWTSFGCSERCRARFGRPGKYDAWGVVGRGSDIWGVFGRYFAA